MDGDSGEDEIKRALENDPVEGCLGGTSNSSGHFGEDSPDGLFNACFCVVQAAGSILCDLRSSFSWPK